MYKTVKKTNAEIIHKKIFCANKLELNLSFKKNSSIKFSTSKNVLYITINVPCLVVSTYKLQKCK